MRAYKKACILALWFLAGALSQSCSSYNNQQTNCVNAGCAYCNNVCFSGESAATSITAGCTSLSGYLELNGYIVDELSFLKNIQSFNRLVLKNNTVRSLGLTNLYSGTDLTIEGNVVTDGIDLPAFVYMSGVLSVRYNVARNISMPKLNYITAGPAYFQHNRFTNDVNLPEFDRVTNSDLVFQNNTFRSGIFTKFRTSPNMVIADNIASQDVLFAGMQSTGLFDISRNIIGGNFAVNSRITVTTLQVRDNMIAGNVTFSRLDCTLGSLYVQRNQLGSLRFLDVGQGTYTTGNMTVENNTIAGAFDLSPFVRSNIDFTLRGNSFPSLDMKLFGFARVITIEDNIGGDLKFSKLDRADDSLLIRRNHLNSLRFIDIGQESYVGTNLIVEDNTFASTFELTPFVRSNVDFVLRRNTFPALDMKVFISARTVTIEDNTVTEIRFSKIERVDLSLTIKNNRCDRINFFRLLPKDPYVGNANDPTSFVRIEDNEVYDQMYLEFTNIRGNMTIKHNVIANLTFPRMTDAPSILFLDNVGYSVNIPGFQKTVRSFIAKDNHFNSFGIPAYGVPSTNAQIGLNDPIFEFTWEHNSIGALDLDMIGLVKGNVSFLNNNFGSVTMARFFQAENMRIENNVVTSWNIPAFKRTGLLTLLNNTLGTFALPQAGLSAVVGTATVQDNTCDVLNLEAVYNLANGFVVNNVFKRNFTISEVAFLSGDLILERNCAEVPLVFNKLTMNFRLWVKGNTFTGLALPEAGNLGTLGVLVIQDNIRLRNISAPKLSKAPVLDISGNHALEVLETFPILSIGGADITIANNQNLTRLAGFNHANLQNVAALRIENNPNLVVLTAFAALKTFSTLSVQGNTILQLTSANFPSLVSQSSSTAVFAGCSQCCSEAQTLYSRVGSAHVPNAGVECATTCTAAAQVPCLAALSLAPLSDPTCSVLAYRAPYTPLPVVLPPRTSVAPTPPVEVVSSSTAAVVAVSSSSSAQSSSAQVSSTVASSTAPSSSSSSAAASSSLSSTADSSSFSSTLASVSSSAVSSSVSSSAPVSSSIQPSSTYASSSAVPSSSLSSTAAAALSSSSSTAAYVPPITVCSSGAYPVGELCEPCVEDYYSPDGTACVACPPQSHTVAQGSTARSDCLCASGYVRNNATDDSAFLCVVPTPAPPPIQSEYVQNDGALPEVADSTVRIVVTAPGLSVLDLSKELALCGHVNASRFVFRVNNATGQVYVDVLAGSAGQPTSAEVFSVIETGLAGACSSALTKEKVSLVTRSGPADKKDTAAALYNSAMFIGLLVAIVVALGLGLAVGLWVRSRSRKQKLKYATPAESTKKTALRQNSLFTKMSTDGSQSGLGEKGEPAPAPVHVHMYIMNPTTAEEASTAQANMTVEDA